MKLLAKKIFLGFLLLIGLIAIIILVYVVLSEGKTILAIIAVLYLILSYYILLKIGKIRYDTVFIKEDKIKLNEFFLGEIVKEQIISWDEITGISSIIHLGDNSLGLLISLRDDEMKVISERINGWNKVINWIEIKIPNYNNNWMEAIRHTKEPIEIYKKK